MSSAALIMLLLAAGDDAPAKESDRQAAVAELAPAKAKTLAVLCQEAAIPCALHEGPLLRWSNPTAGSVYGEVFLWSLEGRPVALASIYRWYHPFHDATVEFASISENPVSARDGAEPVWDATSPGIAFKNLQGAPAPAVSAGPRLAQMKAIARDFSAQLLDERGGEEVQRQLRLLNQPVHRYAAPALGVIDGALFGFVEGTDPEAWLLIEAFPDGEGKAWRYALARMNVDAISIRYREANVQTWPNIREAWRNRKAPYTLFSFDPETVEKPSAAQKPSAEEEKP